jgi:hypothetical protein
MTFSRTTEGVEHAGCAGLRPYEPGDQVDEVGLQFRPAYWGQGLAEDVGPMIITSAFDNLSVKGLFAGHTANAVSRRVLEKLGVLFQGGELCPPTGLQHPSYRLMRPGVRAKRHGRSIFAASRRTEARSLRSEFPRSGFKLHSTSALHSADMSAG